MIVYSKPNCPQCDMTKKELDRLGIKYKVVDLTQDHEALTRLKDLGYRQAPVVEAGNYVWSGYKPKLIQEYAETVN